ncbi:MULTISPECIES: hypothetical protein [unclassified Paenibacillus]|nr:MULTISPECIES: hypothetical protein [unclassified Paenibacillus]
MQIMMRITFHNIKDTIKTNMMSGLQTLGVFGLIYAMTFLI